MNGQFIPATLFGVLRDLYLQEQSGVLTLSRTQVQKRLYFDRGMLYFADSSLDDERLVDFLVRTETLGVEEATELCKGQANDLALARSFLESKRMSPEKLQQAFQDMIQQVVTSTFRWDSGEWAFHEGTPGEGQLFSMDVVLTFSYLMRGIRSMARFTPVREALLRLDRPLRMSDALALPLDKLTLHPMQGFVLSRVDGASRIREIASLIPPSEEDIALRFLFGLLVLGVIQTCPPLGAGTFSVTELLNIDRDDKIKVESEASLIKETYRTISSATPWEILGVDESADTQAIRKAYQSRKEAFVSSRFHKKIQEAYREELVLIESKFLEAYLALAENLIRSAKQVSAPGAGAVTLDMDTLSKRKELTKTELQQLLEEKSQRADQFYTKAREHFRSKDFYGAIQYCDQAIKAHEKDSRFHSLLGQALMQNPDYKWQKRAEHSLLRAAELDPWNAGHFVHLGNFYRSHNLLRKAKKQFLKASEVAPTHSEALEALDDLKKVKA